jgi:hypothetical protein
MLEIALGFLARSAVMIPVLVLVSAGVWLALRKLGWLKLDGPVDMRDMRTWPFSYVMVDAAIFGLVFAAIASVPGDNAYGSALGGFAAALVSFGIVPSLLAKYWR